MTDPHFACNLYPNRAAAFASSAKAHGVAQGVAEDLARAAVTVRKATPLARHMTPVRGGDE